MIMSSKHNPNYDGPLSVHKAFSVAVHCRPSPAEQAWVYCKACSAASKSGLMSPRHLFDL